MDCVVPTFSNNQRILARGISFHKLPLPNQIKNMKNKSIHKIPEDDPNMHDGRARSFQHERGNWATYVYVSVDILIMDELQTRLKDSVQAEVDLKPPSDVHISLTKTVVLQHHWIESFVSSIRNTFHCVKRFNVQFQRLKVYCNEERSRTFIGMKVTHNALMESITKQLDSILKEYRLPEFYEDPSFHSSILWCVGDHEALLNDNLTRLERIFQSFLSKYSEYFQINVNSIQCKCGNKSFNFELS